MKPHFFERTALALCATLDLRFRAASANTLQDLRSFGRESRRKVGFEVQFGQMIELETFR